jgi:hypothetical protein
MTAAARSVSLNVSAEPCADNDRRAMDHQEPASSAGADGSVRRQGSRTPFRRGLVTGLLLVVLGTWGAISPFLVPSLDMANGPAHEWTLTAGRGWLEVLPGVVTVLGGLMLITWRKRETAALGGWLAVIAGAWFVIGRTFASMLTMGSAGSALTDSSTHAAVVQLAYFVGYGALVVLFGSVGVGRVSVRSMRYIGFDDDGVDNLLGGHRPVTQ